MNIKGIIGRKIAMHQLFTATGEIIPVTYIDVHPNTVTQVKTPETDGYSALQLAVAATKTKKTPKPQVKHLAKSNLKAAIRCREIRNMEKFQLGDQVDLSLFNPGEFVDITGISKGKGTSGVIKRHHFSRGPMTHGSKHHRAPGSIGLSRPDKVWKGHPLPGRKGHEQVKIQNLEIVQIIPTEHLLVVRGSVPGPLNNWLVITSTIKNTKPRPEITFFQAVKEKEVSTTPPPEQSSIKVAPVKTPLKTAAKPQKKTIQQPTSLVEKASKKPIESKIESAQNLSSKPQKAQNDKK